MKSTDLIKNLMTMGWYLHRIKGSHHHFRHTTIKGLVTIPHPSQDLPIGTVKSIMRQAGVFMKVHKASQFHMEKSIATTTNCY